LFYALTISCHYNFTLTKGYFKSKKIFCHHTPGAAATIGFNSFDTAVNNVVIGFYFFKPAQLLSFQKPANSLPKIVYLQHF